MTRLTDSTPCNQVTSSPSKDLQPCMHLAELKELLYSQFGELNRKMDKLNDSVVELKAIMTKKKARKVGYL